MKGKPNPLLIPLSAVMLGLFHNGIPVADVNVVAATHPSRDYVAWDNDQYYVAPLSSAGYCSGEGIDGCNDKTYATVSRYSSRTLSGSAKNSQSFQSVSK